MREALPLLKRKGQLLLCPVRFSETHGGRASPDGFRINRFNYRPALILTVGGYGAELKLSYRFSSGL